MRGITDIRMFWTEPSEGNWHTLHCSLEVYGMNSNAPMSGRTHPFPSPSTTRGFPAKSVGGKLGTDRVPASIAGEVGCSWKLWVATNCGSTETFPLSPV